MERVDALPTTPKALSASNGHYHQDTLVVTDLVEAQQKPDGRVVAVIPAYNEDRFIGSVILKVRPFVDWIIVVDDGSTDQTATIAQDAGAEVVIHCANQGKARALETGFERALDLGADAVVILDADGQHNPSEIPLVVAPVLAGEADMVIGSRFRATKNEIPKWRQAGQHALTLATNVASGVSSSDSQSGFRAFRAAALQTLRIRGQGFAIESELQFWAREQGLRIVEAPISVVYAEKAKRNPIQQAFQVLNGILALVSQSRPLLFFGVSGLLIALLGAGFWYRTVQVYQLTHDLDLVPVILGTLMVTLGVLATFQGITLHTMRRMILGEGFEFVAKRARTNLEGDCGAPSSDYHKA